MYQYPDYMYHHGVKGMKWGVRRYQNADGSLTAAGKKRSQKQLAKSLKKAKNQEEVNEILVSNKHFQNAKKSLSPTKKKAHDATEALNEQFDKEYASNMKRAYKETDKVWDRISKEYPSFYHPEIPKEDNKRYHDYAEAVADSYSSSKKLKKLEKIENDAWLKVSSEADKVVDDLIGSYGDKTFKSLTTKNGRTHTGKDYISQYLEYEYVY